MLTHFGTVFVLCRNYDSLTHLLTQFNTQLTLLKFNKINVSRGTVAKWMLRNVSRGTKVLLMFHVKRSVNRY